ncbi:N-acyl homoserine lactonase family protein [Pararhodobacter sp. CCB-MM2]|uniref:N-acyl homoserine lactonase family protein n=1 Tax=Pararhodobacter sp. CCB-MM2 TaxID=1786003 RepID=UPI00082AA6ED|nr:N-acyl homoserine lactonase family protein [Pararhodobacter sp. CCB-MM2]
MIRPDAWDVVALRYASKTLPSAHLALDADPHEADGQLDYFVWVCRQGDRIVLVDTGFEAGEGSRRGRALILDPVEGLARLGIAAEAVTDVFITHLHYDHAGNLSRFPNARVHLQDAEMAYATGRCMCHARMRKPFSVADVVTAVELVYKDRVVFHDGDFRLYPGLSGKLVGGHSKGLQMLVIGEAAPLVLASDALHLSRYLDDDRIFPAFGDYLATVEGYRVLREMIVEGAEIVPGHDPDVLRHYGRVDPRWEDAVRLRAPVV